MENVPLSKVIKIIEDKFAHLHPFETLDAICQVNELALVHTEVGSKLELMEDSSFNSSSSVLPGNTESSPEWPPAIRWTIERQIQDQSAVLREKVKNQRWSLDFLRTKLPRYHNAHLLFTTYAHMSNPGKEHTMYNQACYGKQNLLIIAKSLDGQYVAGGFTSKTPTSTGQWSDSPGAFLFSLNRQEIYEPTSQTDPNLFFMNADYGPWFGNRGNGWFQMHFATNFREKKNDQFKAGNYLLKDAPFLFGGPEFALEGYEVFQLS